MRNGTRCSYRHVGPCAHEGVGHGVDELPTDPKVTELDLPTGVHEDVGRLDICRGENTENVGVDTGGLGQGKGQHHPDRPALTVSPRTWSHRIASPWLANTGHQGPLFPLVQGSGKDGQERKCQPVVQAGQKVGGFPLLET